MAEFFFIFFSRTTYLRIISQFFKSSNFLLNDPLESLPSDLLNSLRVIPWRTLERAETMALFPFLYLWVYPYFWFAFYLQRYKIKRKKDEFFPKSSKLYNFGKNSVVFEHHFKKFEWNIDSSPNSVHPLFMGFYEGRGTTFGVVRTETCMHSLCRVVTKEDRMSMAVQEAPKNCSHMENVSESPSPWFICCKITEKEWKSPLRGSKSGFRGCISERFR